MYRMHTDTTSSDRPASAVLLRLAALTAIAFALVAASVSAAPSFAVASASAADASAPQASAAAKCTAQIQKGKKYVPVYEYYYKYAFKKAKKSKAYKRVVVRARRKLKVSCARQCVRTKVVKKKRVPVYKLVRKKVKVKKGTRIVTARKKVRVYTFEKCKTLPGNNASVNQTVKITMLADSYADLDFGAFKRRAPITGTLRGLIPGGYKTSQDNLIQLSSADLRLGQTDVFIDDLCKGKASAAIRTGDPTAVSLNPTKQSSSTLTAAGGVTAIAYTTIRLPLEMRNDDDGCDDPYITTGYTEFDQTFFLKGKLGGGSSLTKLTLTSPPDPLDVVACMVRGTPTSPCSGFAIPLPIIVSTHLVVNIDLRQ